MKSSKAKAFLFSLSMGMFLSGSVAVALPNNDGCEDLRIQCEMGDSEACSDYDRWCLPCEAWPDQCTDEPNGGPDIEWPYGDN